MVRTEGKKYVVNEGGYLEDVRSIMTHWGGHTKVLSVQFKVVKEFQNADMMVIAHNKAGFEEQWFLNDVLSVQKALFSHLLKECSTENKLFITYQQLWDLIQEKVMIRYMYNY